MALTILYLLLIAKLRGYPKFSCTLTMRAIGRIFRRIWSCSAIITAMHVIETTDPDNRLHAKCDIAWA